MPSSVINSDNGAISGTSGLKTTGGDDGLLNIQSNGTNVVEVSSGVVAVKGTSSGGAAVRLYEDTDNGTNYVGLSSPASIASNYTLTLPSADGTSGQVLQTNGSGTLSFATPSTGFSGATINAPSSSALTLTNTSTQYQRVQSTSTTNNYVTLPDATTISTKGAFAFFFDNRGLRNQTLFIKNNGGETIGYSAIAETSNVALVDNSTANGKWLSTNINAVRGVFGNTASLTTTTNTTATYNSAKVYILGLSSTKFILYWFTQPSASTTLTIRVKVGDISGNTITFGSEQTTTVTTSQNTNQGGELRALRLSDSSFVLFHGIVSNNGGTTRNSNQGVRTCTVSGTTVTFGTASTLSFPTGNNTSNDSNGPGSASVNCTLVRMADDKFAVIYNTGVDTNGYPTGYSGSLTCNIITVSGTTQTVGTKVDLGSSTYTQTLGAGCYDTDKLLVCYGQGTAGSKTGRSKVVVITVSGTTPTWGTPVNIQSADSPSQTDQVYKNMIVISTSKCLVFYRDGTGVSDIPGKIAMVSISVTTPTVDYTLDSSNSGNIDYLFSFDLTQLTSDTWYLPTYSNECRFIYGTSDGGYAPSFAALINSAYGPASVLPGATGENNIITTNASVATTSVMLATAKLNGL